MQLNDLIANTQNALSTDIPVLGVCPLCQSPNITSLGVRHTLVGTYGKYDGNHYWHHYNCADCYEATVLEYKGESEGYNWWVTHNNHSISGMSSCWEKVSYDCKCGGVVKCVNRSVEGDLPTNVLSYNFITGKKSYYEYWVCDTCGEGVRIN